MTNNEPVPNVTTVTTENRNGTIVVKATDQGMPLDIRVAQSELRYGADALAAEIMRLTKQAATEAGARRREELAKSGVPEDVLNRLGLPTREQAIEDQWASDEQEIAPVSWKRPV